jgi:chaperonin GroEL
VLDSYGILPLLKSAILYPAMLTRAALENAASIAVILLTTSTLIADKPEKENPPAMPPGTRESRELPGLI